MALISGVSFAKWESCSVLGSDYALRGFMLQEIRVSDRMLSATISCPFRSLLRLYTHVQTGIKRDELHEVGSAPALHRLLSADAKKAHVNESCVPKICSNDVGFSLFRVVCSLSLNIITTHMYVCIHVYLHMYGHTHMYMTYVHLHIFLQHLHACVHVYACICQLLIKLQMHLLVSLLAVVRQTCC